MATKTFKVALSLDNPRIIQSGIDVRSFDKESIKIAIELTKNSQTYQIPTGAQIKISLLKLARQEQKIILDVPFTSAEAIEWLVPDYLDGYQGEVRVGVYLIAGTENIDVGYFNIASSVSDIDNAAEEFTESVMQGWAIEDLLALQPQFQAVLDETTGKDVISAPEIILARGGFDSLGERLDSEKADVTAQLAQKATKGEITSGDLDISSDGYKIKLINLADEVQQALTGNAPALSVIPYKSITKEKLGFTKIVSRNMFNKATVTAGKKINRTTGILVDDVNYYTSDFIEVDSNTEYVINSAYDGAYFDSNFNYVSGLQPTTLGAFYVFTTPSNVKYLKISLHNTVLDTLQMEIGNVRTAYEPYLSLIDSGAVEGINDLKASVNDLEASDSDFGNALNLTSDIKNTNQSVTFNSDGTVQKITHTDKTTSAVVREDIFTYTINLITEVRTLPNSATITYKYHLDTMQTEVI